MFVGDSGKILCGFNGANPHLIPKAKMDAFQPPPKTLPRSPGNEREWLNACKGDKTKPGANFEFTGMVTETLHLGNVASMTGERLHWDRATMRATNTTSADKWVKPERRKGWEI